MTPQLRGPETRPFPCPRGQKQVQRPPPADKGTTLRPFSKGLRDRDISKAESRVGTSRGFRAGVEKQPQTSAHPTVGHPSMKP